MSEHRILIATYFDANSVGGVSSHIHTLVSALQKRGNAVKLIGGSKPERGSAKWRHAVMALGNRDAYRVSVTKQKQHELAEKIMVEVENWRPDLIHVHDVYAGSALAELERLSLPVVLTVHGPAAREATMAGVAPVGSRYLRYVDMAERTALLRANHVIAVDSLQRELALAQGVSPEAVSVILNAVDVPPLPTHHGVPAQPYLLVPRRLVAKNGVSVAVEAFARLSPRFPALQLWVAGGGPLLSALQERVHELGLSSAVRFLGDVPHVDMSGYFTGATVVLIPSVPSHGVVEASSIAALEAMALAKPVVASGIGGLRELIESGRSGILVPPADSDALATAVETLLSDETMRAALGAGARSRVEQRHGVNRWADHVLSVYDRVRPT